MTDARGEGTHWLLELRCPACALSTTLDVTAGMDWLRSLGKLRANSDATPDVIRELVRAIAGEQVCSGCRAAILTCHDVRDAEDWPSAPRCLNCQRLIPPERLEVFPGTELCVACQGQEDRGQIPSVGEYCSKCGSPLVMRPTTGAGIRRYKLVCSGNPPCR